MSVVPFRTRRASTRPACVIHVHRRREVWAVALSAADGDEILALALEREDAITCGSALAAARALPMTVEGERAHG